MLITKLKFSNLKEWLANPAMGNIPNIRLVAGCGVYWANMQLLIGGGRRSENRDK